MPRIEPLSREELPQHEAILEMVEASLGFVPNSMLTMARVPGLLESFGALGATVLGNDLIPRGLKQMIALMASAGAGCRYCQAHTGHGAERVGVPAEKLEAIWEFETNAAFDEAERAALRLAFRAGQTPNATTDADFGALQEHYDEQQITAIVAVIALFGYLNRWNDTMATALESSPLAFGSTRLSGAGWDPGKHVV
jgi:uncharacterized peroxidase-related enzyme